MSEILKFWEQYALDRNSDDRDHLIEHYLHLVKFVVGRVASGLPSHVKMDDLYSSGLTGLIRAVEKFDVTKKNKFETYAIFVIKGAIIDELRKLDWVPRSIHQKAGRLTDAQETLQRKLGRDPTDEELARHLGLSDDEYHDLLRDTQPILLVPLNAEFTYAEDCSLADKIADAKAETSLTIADRKEFCALLAKAIADLPEQERRVLTLYYYEELMLKEIGKVLGVTESRVSQIHSKALVKLRGRLKKILKEYV